MPSATLHLTHAELLAEDPALCPSIRAAMQQEITYARLGAVFHDLPFYTNIVTMVLGYWLEMPAEYCPFAQRLHRYHPDLFAWHFLREASKGGLLTSDQRLAMLGGFLAHVALDLEVHPLVNWCARRDVLDRGGHDSHHHRLTEKYQSLFFHRDLQGDDIIGRPRFFTEKARIVEHHLFFRLNLDLPVIRWATEVLAGFFHGSAPSMRQFSGWVRSFRHFALAVSLPMAHINSQRVGNDENRERYFDNPDFSFMDFWQRGYDRSVKLLNLAGEIIEAGDYAEASRDEFLHQAEIADLAYPPEKHLPPLPEAQDVAQGLRLTG